jgi:hypothetical protein
MHFHVDNADSSEINMHISTALQCADIQCDDFVKVTLKNGKIVCIYDVDDTDIDNGKVSVQTFDNETDFENGDFENVILLYQEKVIVN